MWISACHGIKEMTRAIVGRVFETDKEMQDFADAVRGANPDYPTVMPLDMRLIATALHESVLTMLTRIGRLESRLGISKKEQNDE